MGGTLEGQEGINPEDTVAPESCISQHTKAQKTGFYFSSNNPVPAENGGGQERRGPWSVNQDLSLKGCVCHWVWQHRFGE